MGRPPRRLALPAVLVALLVTAGCLGGGGPPPSDPAAERAVDRLVNASADIDAFRADGTGTAVATKGDRSERITYQREVRVNRTMHRGRVTNAADGERKTLYLLGDSAYRLCPTSQYVNVRDVWYPALDVGTDWRTNDTLGRFVATLDAANVQMDGHARVGGTNATVVVAHPTADDLRRYGRTFERLNDRRVGTIEDARFRAWIANDTGRLLRLDTTVNSTTQGVSVTQTLTLRYEYGGSVTVAGPESRVSSEGACPPRP